MKPSVAYTPLPAKEFAVEKEPGHRAGPANWRIASYAGVSQRMGRARVH